MKTMRLIFTTLILTGIAISCSKVPITGRHQMKLLPKSTLNSMALTQYKEFLRTHTLSSNVADREMVTRVGQRIQKATEVYFKAIGKSKLLEGYKWEFNLVQDPVVNAWCMPGGKVVVYTGLLPVTQNEDALAVVMGHEIAHAIANHGNERMSQMLAAQTGGLALSVALSNKPAETQNIFLGAYGVTSQVAILLPYSRIHETEADEIGLVLMAIAGYNPEEAIPFWGRMDKSGGDRPPEFLSTHPAPKNRADNLKLWIPKAKAYANKYKI
jgi:predicted Zn-dependent protease